LGKFTGRLKHAWNAFKWQDAHPGETMASPDAGPSYSYRPDRTRFRFTNEKTIIAGIYTRIAIDVAAVPIKHVRLDDNQQYQQDMQTSFNDCLTVEPNIDQSPRMFRQDIVQSLFDWGVVAILPVDTTLNPLSTGGYDINSMRVGRILQWWPKHVTVRAYDENTGIQRDIIVPKNMVAIVENPLYAVMNERSSTLQRLLRKLALLDAVDEQSASGNLDIIIQLPYVIKTETRRAEAEKRIKEIEFQLKGSKYGIAYTDGTEKVTQLNRPAENNLMAQVQYLTTVLYSQLGITDTVMNGTANEETMLNYYNRTIEPILAAIAEAMTRTFLTKTARSQNQTVMYIRDPFKLVPVTAIAEIADKFRRNEILTSNEIRSIVAIRPSSDPHANLLLNPNIPAAYGELPQNGVALNRPKLPPKSPVQEIPAIPQAAPSQGVNSQNGT
jgi:Phage portal protein